MKEITKPETNSSNWFDRLMSKALTGDDWDRDLDSRPVNLEPMPITLKPSKDPSLNMSREELELAILGCILMTNRLVLNAEVILPSRYYFSEKNRRIFYAMRNKYRSGVRFALYNLDVLGLDDVSEKSLFHSTNNVATSHHIEYFCKALKGFVHAAG